MPERNCVNSEPGFIAHPNYVDETIFISLEFGIIIFMTSEKTRLFKFNLLICDDELKFFEIFYQLLDFYS